MKILDCLYIAWHGIAKNINKSVLSALSVCVAILSVVTVLNISKSGSGAIEESVSDIGLNGVAVISEDVSFSESDIEVLTESLNNVDEIMPLNVEYGHIKINGVNKDSIIWGIGINAEKILSTKLLYGRYPDKKEISSEALVAVIDEEYAQKLYKRSNIVGKSIEIVLNSKRLSFEIIGISKAQSSMFSAASITIPGFAYIPYTTLNNITENNKIKQLAITFENNDYNESDITNVLKRYCSGNYVIENISGYKNVTSDITAIISLLLTAIASVSIIVSGTSVMNSMLSSAKENKREIGIMKSLGASRNNISCIYLLQSIIITMLGAAAGIISGTISSIMICSIINLKFKIDLSCIVYPAAASIVIGALFGLIPALKASKLSPVDALYR